jgi:hypothetical protein
MRLYHGYNSASHEIITKAIIFAKQVVIDYYDEIYSGYVREIRAFGDDERSSYHKEMNETLDYVLDEKNLGKEINENFWRQIDNIVIGSIKVYYEYLLYQSGGIESARLDAELETIKKIFDQNKPEPESDYTVYQRFYNELTNITKLSDLEEDEFDTEEETQY